MDRISLAGFVPHIGEGLVTVFAFLAAIFFNVLFVFREVGGCSRSLIMTDPSETFGGSWNRLPDSGNCRDIFVSDCRSQCAWSRSLCLIVIQGRPSEGRF